MNKVVFTNHYYFLNLKFLSYFIKINNNYFLIIKNNNVEHISFWFLYCVMGELFHKYLFFVQIHTYSYKLIYDITCTDNPRIRIICFVLVLLCLENNPAYTYLVSISICVIITAIPPVKPIRAIGLILGNNSLLKPGIIWHTLQKQRQYLNQLFQKYVMCSNNQLRLDKLTA